MMKRIIHTFLVTLALLLPTQAAPDPKEQVETYFKALLANRLDMALQTFGASTKFNDSQKAVLGEFKLVDPTSVGYCEEHLAELGKALAKFSGANSGYPETLSALAPEYLAKIPRCPSAPNAAYEYDRRDVYFYLLSCPTGHGRTPGFPKYSPIDGLLPNPNLKLLTYYKVMDVREESGLTKVRVVGATPKGIFERDFVFTPSGGFVEGDFSKEVERLLQGIATRGVPLPTKLDPASLLLGVATFRDPELVRAAHCHLLQNKVAYQLLGMQTRMGERSFLDIFPTLVSIPKCPTSGKPLQARRAGNGKTVIYCPGQAHTGAGLAEDQPSKEI